MFLSKIRQTHGLKEWPGHSLERLTSTYFVYSSIALVIDNIFGEL